MPFRSRAQARYMFAAEARGELPKGTALEFAHATKDIKKLPERLHPKKKQPTAKTTKAAAAVAKLACELRSPLLAKTASLVCRGYALDDIIREMQNSLRINPEPGE